MGAGVFVLLALIAKMYLADKRSRRMGLKTAAPTMPKSLICILLIIKQMKVSKDEGERYKTIKIIQDILYSNLYAIKFCISLNVSFSTY